MQTKRTNFYKYMRPMALASILTLGSQQTLAQDDLSQEELEDLLEFVVVTARLIDEDIQDVPVSISAFNGQMIEDQGIDNLTEIARMTPNFTFEDYNGAIATPVIRGQSQNRLTNPVQNVGTFYNGVYIQRGYMIDASLLNIGQVEILRGPQSAAFGRNAYAGALNFRTKSIGDEYTAYVAVSAGEDEYQRVDATAELPFSGVFKATAGVSIGEYDGAWKNNHALADSSDRLARTSGNVDGYEYDAYHLGFELTPTDNVSIKANYMSSERDIENPAQYALSGSGLFSVNTLNCSENFGANSLFCGEFSTDAPTAGGRNEGIIIDPRTGVTLESDILSVDAKIDFTDDLSLNLLYGRTEGTFEGAGSSGYNQEVGYDGPFASAPLFLGNNLIDTSGNGEIESDSFEARLTWDDGGDIQAYGGAYYSDSDDLTKFALRAVPAQTEGPLSEGFEIFFPGFAANSLNSREVTSAFGFINYKVGDWAFSAEGRYTNEKITETNKFVEVPTSESQDYNYFTPKLSATWFLNDESSIYVSYGKGLKAGGFNTGGSDRSTFAEPSEATFDEETNNTYELGSRNVFMDGDLTFNATAFYIDASDLQVNVPKTGATGNIIANAAEAQTFGIELELMYDISEDLQLMSGLGYTNAEYGDDVIDPSNSSRCDDILCARDGDISGNQLERAPEITFNVGFDYTASLTDSTDFFLRGNASYQDEMFSNAINTAILESRTIVDMSFGATYDNFEAKVSVDNLLDEEYVSSAFEIGFSRTYVPNLGDGRKAAVTVSYRFK